MYKIFAFVVVVLAGVFVAPVAASAVPYTPGAQIVASVTNLTPGESTQITAGDGYFGAGQSVHVAVSGTAASDWSVPSSLSADSTGGTTFVLTAPSSSTGQYTVTLTSSSDSGSVVLTVTPNPVSHGRLSTPGHPGTAGSAGVGPIAITGGAGHKHLAHGSSSDPTGASYDGMNIQMIIIWALVALIALLLAFIIVTRIRRHEQTTA